MGQVWYTSVSHAVMTGSVDPFMAILSKFRQNRVARDILVATGQSQLYQGVYEELLRDRVLEYIRGLFVLGYASDIDRFPTMRFVSLFALIGVRHTIESIMVRYPVLCTWICSNVSMLSRTDHENINRLPSIYLFIIANRLRVSGADRRADHALQVRMRDMSITGQQQFLRER
jgi:hypothetical protein